MEGPDREVKVNLNKEGVQEEVTLMYRSAPCNSTHSQKVVKSTAGAGPCPVEFGYLYPKDYKDDHRRWILGFVHHQKEPTSNIHNHPIHAAAKMCSKVKECIAEAIHWLAQQLSPLI